jgi:hypothetical protein
MKVCDKNHKIIVKTTKEEKSHLNPTNKNLGRDLHEERNAPRLEEPKI